MKPKVVTLCGSSRFQEEHEAMQARETLLGKIVIPMGFYHHKQQVPITAEQKVRLDQLHFRKIDLSDEILVVNPNGYIGESTSGEIAYAIANGKIVNFTDKEAGEKYLEREAHMIGKKVSEFVAPGLRGGEGF